MAARTVTASRLFCMCMMRRKELNRVRGTPSITSDVQSQVVALHAKRMRSDALQWLVHHQRPMPGIHPCSPPMTIATTVECIRDEATHRTDDSHMNTASHPSPSHHHLHPITITTTITVTITVTNSITIPTTLSPACCSQPGCTRGCSCRCGRSSGDGGDGSRGCVGGNTGGEWSIVPRAVARIVHRALLWGTWESSDLTNTMTKDWLPRCRAPRRLQVTMAKNNRSK